MQNTLTFDRGQSLFTTSTHTGHHWRPGYYFPSSNFKTVINDPIPQALNTKDQVLPNIHFETTNKVYHDNKYPNQEIYNDPLSLKHTKPLPSYKVNYINDVVEKLNSKPRRPLTMGFQKSEYKEEYEPEHPNELVYMMDRPIHPRNYLYDDEMEHKLTQKCYDGEVRGDVPPPKPIDPSQIGVLNLLDPYMTTYNKEHKKWNKDQLKGIAKKDVVTIYDADQIRDSTLLPENKPMRDEIWFKSDAKQRQVHCPPKPVPNNGLKTEMRDNYTIPTDVKAKNTKLCPIDTPYVLPAQSSKSVFATQEMYKTEYTNIGRGRLPINQFN